jgi:phage tail tube protein FII
MASQPLLICRGFNVFADGLNVGLPLTTMKIPIPPESGDSVTFGGTRGAIEIPTSMDAPEATFATKGIQPDLIRQYAPAFGQRRTYTLLGALVDEFSDDLTKRPIPVVCTAIGRLSPEMDDKEGGAMGGTSYTIKSIVKLTCVMGGTEVFRYDLKLGGWLDTQGMMTDIASLIGLNA